MRNTDGRPLNSSFRLTPAFSAVRPTISSHPAQTARAVSEAESDCPSAEAQSARSTPPPTGNTPPTPACGTSDDLNDHFAVPAPLPITRTASLVGSITSSTDLPSESEQDSDQSSTTALATAGSKRKRRKISGSLDGLS